MNEGATITVLSGPNRGAVYRLEGDGPVHVGRDASRRMWLGVEEPAEHHLSLVRRNGRYALYTVLENGVAVGGTTVPARRWVWLPAQAQIQVGQETMLRFQAVAAEGGQESVGQENGPANSNTATAGPRRAGKGRQSGKAGSGKGRQVARFVTDRDGAPRVTLGEDGHLPELALAETVERKQSRQRAERSNPAVVYGIVAMSLVMSLVLLFVDMEPPGSGAQASKAQARRELAAFYGTGREELEPYQRYLRRARLAHSRGDEDAERRAYRRVLDLLNSEDNSRLTGLTGDPERDERLRRLLAILLRK